MKLSRRQALLGGAAFLALPPRRVAAFKHGSVVSNQLASGWGTLPLGDGGLITGVDVVNSGAGFGAVCKTDVGGAYYWQNNKWNQICTLEAVTGISANPPLAWGVWEIRVAPTDPGRIYMVWDALTNVFGQYNVYTSTTGGLGLSSLSQTSLSFRTQGYSYWSTDIANSGYGRLGTGKMVIDPANSLVCYVGIPKGCVLMGTYAGQDPTVLRTYDGGVTWAVVPGIPLPCNVPGYCGMVMDPNSGTTVVGGHTVTKRIIIPVCGRGVWESTDGGLTFNQIADDPQTVTLTYTTSINNSMIVIQSACMGNNEIVGATATAGPAGISYPATFALRAAPWTGTTTVPATPRGVVNNFGLGVGFEHYLLCPTAGTYSITIQCASGGMSYRDDIELATATLGTYSNSGGSGGATFTEGGTVTGTFAVGMEIHTFAGGLFGTKTRIKSLISSTPNKWQLNGYQNMDQGDPITAQFTGAITPAYQINVFAVNNVDMVNPWGNWDPVQGNIQFTSPLGIITTSTSLLVAMYGMLGTGTPDAGFTRNAYDANTGFWAEISSAPQAAGTYFPLTGTVPPYYIIDAIKQGSGTIAIDPNGAQYFRVDLSAQLQPCNIQQGQLDHSGTYWCVNGPTTQQNPTGGNPVGPGGIYRYKSGVWDRISGSLAAATYASQTYTLSLGWPSNNVFGAMFVDPRLGHEGRVAFALDTVTHAAQTLNGNAALNSITWTDTGNQSDPPPTSSIFSTIGWLNKGTHTPGTLRTTAAAAAVDPTTGDVWFACGYGMIKATSLDYAVPSYAFTGVNNAQGIEEMLVQTCLSPPGWTAGKVLVGVQDECCMLAGDPTGATAIVQDPNADAHCWSIDYASDNPAFVTALVLDQNSVDNSGFSISHGDQGSWHNFNRSFTLNAGTSGSGGSIACASVGSDGLIAGNATACMMAVTGINSQNVKYTTNNGTTAWNVCGWAPADNYGQGSGLGSTAIVVCADRVDIGTYYLFANSHGVYKTTDFGATGSLVFSVTQTAALFPTIYSTPGHAGHVWLAGVTPGVLYFSSTHGSAMANINTDVNCTFFTMGKAAPAASYPTLFIFGIVSGSSALGGNSGKTGFWRSIDQGATWTLFGQAADYGASGGLYTGPTMLRGDWNIFGRIYSGWGFAGAIYFSP